MKKILTALSSVLICSCFGAGLVTVPIGPGVGSGSGGTAVSAGSGITMVTNGNVVTISSTGGSAAGPFTNTLTYGDKFTTNQFYVYTNMMIGSNLVFLLTNINGSSLYWNAGSGLSVTNLTLTGAILYSNSKQTNALYIDIGDAGVSNAVGNVHFNNGNVSMSGSNWVALSQTIGQSATNLGNSWFGSVQQGEIDTIGQGFLANIVSKGFVQAAAYSGANAAYVTNNLYFPTNTFVNGTIDASKPWQLMITNNTVTINAFANLTNGVPNIGRLWISNSGAASITLTTGGGIKLYGDDTSAILGTLQITNAKMGKVEWDVVQGVWSNVVYFPQKN